MKSAWPIYLKLSSLLLILLWVYTGSSKLLDFNEFRVQLALQNVPIWSKSVLLYTLPVVELVVALLLVFSKTELAGLWASLILMVVFTIYVGMAVFGGFLHVPCSCGGVIRAMGWKIHFFFNLFFLLLTCTAIFIHYKKGGIVRA